MGKENKKESKKEKVQKPKTLRISDVFETEAVKGGTKKELIERVITAMKAGGVEKTVKGTVIEVSVKRQVSAMLAEVGKRGRWQRFKNVGTGDQIRLEAAPTQ